MCVETPPSLAAIALRRLITCLPLEHNNTCYLYYPQDLSIDEDHWATYMDYIRIYWPVKGERVEVGGILLGSGFGTTVMLPHHPFPIPEKNETWTQADIVERTLVPLPLVAKTRASTIILVLAVYVPILITILFVPPPLCDVAVRSVRLPAATDSRCASPGRVVRYLSYTIHRKQYNTTAHKTPTMLVYHLVPDDTLVQYVHCLDVAARSLPHCGVPVACFLWSFQNFQWV